MTRWCPVCENPGLRVAVDGENGDDSIIRAGRDLPGIAPTHFCSRCPTFFNSRDRFYFTGQHGGGIYGIGVWPHHERHMSIEVGQEGLIAAFHDGASVLITREDTNLIATDFFRRSSGEEIVAWARRRGFGLKVTDAGGGIADLVVDRPGPHFILVSVKAWFQRHEIGCTEDGLDCLDMIGASPVLFPPTMLAAG